MNVVLFGMVVIAFLTAAIRQLMWAGAAGEASPLETLSKAVVQSAGDSVALAIGLIGVMTLFLGLVKVAEAGGLLRVIARLIRPLMVRLFPDVPPEHPAMGAMVLNLSANAMGLGNAATPFGIRAMQELDKLNPRPGTTTNAMALFLAINTSSVTLLPTGVIALRAAARSQTLRASCPPRFLPPFCPRPWPSLRQSSIAGFQGGGDGPGGRTSIRGPRPWGEQNRQKTRRNVLTRRG